MKIVSSSLGNKVNNRSSSSFTDRRAQHFENNKDQQQQFQHYNTKLSSYDRLESLHCSCQELDDKFQHMLTRIYEIIYNLVLYFINNFMLKYFL